MTTQEIYQNPPTTAPTIPLTIVNRKPPGSLPGMINLPRIPAMSPTTIQEMIPISIFLLSSLSGTTVLAERIISSVSNGLRAPCIHC